jgi:hypothetical protein
VNFRVDDTQYLRTFGDSLGAWSTDTSTAASYVSTNTHLEWSDAMMFQPVVQVNQDVVAALSDVITRLGSVLEGSGLELEAAARMYDGTDHDVAARLDSHYEALGPPAERYHDVSHPDEDTVPEKPDGSPAPTTGAGSGGGGGGGGSW